MPSPRVAMEIAPLMEQRLTFSQSAKDSIRHKGGDYIVKKIITVNSNLFLPREGSMMYWVFPFIKG